MKKIFVILMFTILMFPMALAINIDVEKLSSNEVLIADLDRSVSFDLRIKNNGPTDSFEFYNLLGFQMFPVGTLNINEGQTEIINLKIKPIGELNIRGYYTLEYYIRASDGTDSTQKLTFKIIELSEAFSIGSGDVNVDTNSIEIYVQNEINFNFGEISVSLSSLFFEFSETFNLDFKERKVFNVDLKKDDIKKLTAGFYTIDAEISVLDQTANVEGTIKFEENDLLTTTKKNYGLLINTQIIKKINEGNIIVSSESVIEKNIISRLFTSFSPEPDFVERDGGKISYTWIHEIRPGESFEIIVKTNWMFPFLLIFFVVAIVVLTKQYSKNNLVLRKKVSFVKAKGGEFALKVSIFVQARKYIERVNIIDRLPPLVKIYERFGPEKPTRVDEKTGRLEWNFEKLEAGETRILSYIIYSKVGIIGKFALPSAAGIYESEGEIKESSSNKAFFIAEQRSGDVEE